ncbi:HD domain-containing protein [Candidatus Micrarchaeota archaeon]|nr:HD domain-containing protein [Candidatus Micrarchaeota archaeon]
MIIEDFLYGKYEFKQPVMIDLINSKTVQRLKQISQYGVPEKYYDRKSFSRFDHDVGVAILLDKYGASLSEVVAGVLHDISHTAFSHVVDAAMNNEKESFQDEVLHEFILSKEISSILSNYSYNAEDFLDLSKYPLLEKELPELCADRLDYSLRQLAWEGKDDLVKKILGDLIVFENSFCFKTRETAELFAASFSDLNENHWVSEFNRSRYYLLGKAISLCLDKKIISKKDLFSTDLEVLAKIEASSDPEVKAIIKLLEDKVVVKNNLKKKQRIVDPSFVDSGKLVKLSRVD